MGTWGFTAFEDDTAMEHYDSFCEEGISCAEIETFMDVILKREYNMDLDGLLMEGFDEPVKALVMAEILTQSMGKGSDKFPDDEYHSDSDLSKIDLGAIKKTITPALIDKTISVVQKIRTDKHMHYYVLWEESDNFQKWYDYTDDLIERLR